MQQNEATQEKRTAPLQKSEHAASFDTRFGLEKLSSLATARNATAKGCFMAIITTIRDLLMFDGSAPSVTVALTPSERRLIAAAPDLLAALECFVADIRFDVAVGGNPVAVAAMLKAARAAIRKATEGA